jgi:hypothetical protein
MDKVKPFDVFASWIVTINNERLVFVSPAEAMEYIDFKLGQTMNKDDSLKLQNLICEEMNNKNEAHVDGISIEPIKLAADWVENFQRRKTMNNDNINEFAAFEVWMNEYFQFLKLDVSVIEALWKRLKINQRANSGSYRVCVDGKNAIFSTCVMAAAFADSLSQMNVSSLTIEKI